MNLVVDAFGFFGFVAGAVVSALAAVWIARAGGVARGERWAGMVALACMVGWCVASASFGPASTASAAAGAVTSIAWLGVIYTLFRGDGRDRSLRPIIPLLASIAVVEFLRGALLVAGDGIADYSALLGMLGAAGALVLVHNVHTGEDRSAIRWQVAALLGFWAFILNYHALAYFAGQPLAELDAVRGFVLALVAIVFATGFGRVARTHAFRPSRMVSFRFLSLGVIALYLGAMGLAVSLIDMLGGDLAVMVQVGLLVAAASLSLLWLPSTNLRGWLKVTVIKHFFSHRYDYRTEWMRFNATIGGSAIPLHERVIKALSDITESPGGILFLRGEDGDFEPVALANWAGKTGRIPEGMSDIFVEQALVLDLEQSRGGSNVRGELEMVPDWMLADECAWAAVPLIHFDRLAGIVVLARPEFRRELDWEDFDLLRVVGRQLASYLAEEASQASLQEASRFDEFNRRMAFVMHDIKNLSSQLTLLLRNAEKHADKPEFRSDMLVTLRSSADKLNAMLARLGRYAQSSPQRRREVDLASAARAVCARYAGSHPVAMVRSDEVRAEVDPEALEQALAHIVQNAVEASDERAAVLIEVVNEGLSGRITVTDTGEGMEPAFLRNGLFKPFTSTKEGGFGIGAFEARETIKAMGGRLDVESHPGLGTRFTLSFPASAMGRLAAAQPEAA